MPSSAPLSIAHAMLVDALLLPVLEAARIQLAHFRCGTAVTTKVDTSPVTAADQESEAVLVAALARVAPSIAVVAEEACAAGWLPKVGTKAGAEFFLVDPLDGTREFIAGRPEFTINIALLRDGQPRFGLIYAPATGVLYATLGDDHAIEARVAPATASARLADLAAVRIHARRPPADGLVAVASRSHGSAGTDAILGQYRIQRRVAAGSSLKFCEIAKGAADIYPRVGLTCEWDTAAGHAILAAAGGSVTTLDGAPLRYGKYSDRFRNPDFIAWGVGGPLPARF